MAFHERSHHAVRAGDREAGIALATTLILAMALLLLGVGVMTRAFSFFDDTESDRRWEEALFVAEAGVENVLEALNADADYATLPADTDLSTRGFVLAAAKTAATAPNAMLTTPDGDAVLLKPAGASYILVVGFSPSIDTPRHSTRVVRAEYAYAPAELELDLPDGALVSNRDILVVGTGTTITDPADQHVASALANGDFTGTGNMSIDGSVAAQGTVSISGNADIYDPDFPEGLSGAPPMAFPTQEQVDAQQEQLIAEAQTGPEIDGYSGSSDLIWQAPLYVNGNIRLSGGSITILPAPTGLPNVVYVAGSIQLTGKADLISGALLASEGTFSMAGQAEYRITGDALQVGMVSFADDPEAIKLTGGSASDTHGVAYAANGGIKLSGGGTYVGSLVAGGADGDDKIKVAGNGTVVYPAELNTQQRIVPRAVGTGEMVLTSRYEL